MNILHKRGKTSGVNAYTGPAGELVVDTDKNTVLVQDGKTSGGTVLAKYSDVDNRINKARNRGLLAGYETLATIAATSTVTPNSPDSLYVTGNGGAITLTFSGGVAQTASMKTIFCYNGSSITLNGVNLWAGDNTAPTIKKSAIIVVGFFDTESVFANVASTWGD